MHEVQSEIEKENSGALDIVSVVARTFVLGKRSAAKHKCTPTGGVHDEAET